MQKQIHAFVVERLQDAEQIRQRSAQAVDRPRRDHVELFRVYRLHTLEVHQSEGPGRPHQGAISVSLEGRRETAGLLLFCRAIRRVTVTERTTAAIQLYGFMPDSRNAVCASPAKPNPAPNDLARLSAKGSALARLRSAPNRGPPVRAGGEFWATVSALVRSLR
jgi:hypothetical protein